MDMVSLQTLESIEALQEATVRELGMIIFLLEYWKCFNFLLRPSYAKYASIQRHQRLVGVHHTTYLEVSGVVLTSPSRRPDLDPKMLNYLVTGATIL